MFFPLRCSAFPVRRSYELGWSFLIFRRLAEGFFLEFI